jgi:hypothetical protein
VNANRVADAEFRQVLAQAPLFELLDNGIHGKKDLESSQLTYPNARIYSMGAGELPNRPVSQQKSNSPEVLSP